MDTDLCTEEELHAQFSPFCDAPCRLGKHKFTADEDALLANLVLHNGVRDWAKIASLMKTRNARQCRDRYNHFLNPTLDSGAWTTKEDDLILMKHDEYGVKWHKIARFFENRSDIALRNRYNVLRRRRARQQAKASSPEGPNGRAQEPELVVPLVPPQSTPNPAQPRFPDELFDAVELSWVCSELFGCSPF
jgi:hypothetical protein